MGEVVHRQTTSAPRTASSADAIGVIRGSMAASGCASSSDAETTRMSVKSRTRDSIRTCAAPCTPAPMMARVRESGRDSSRVDSAAPPAVRIAVM